MKKILLFSVIFALFGSVILQSQVVFQKRYGLNNDNLDQAAGGVLAPDGSLVLTGYTELAQDYEIFIQKLNPDGTEAWYKTLNNPGLDITSGLIAAAGGGYFVSGLTLNPDNGSFDAMLLKVNENGALLWRKNFGGPATDAGFAICEMTTGQIVLLGSTMLPNNQPAHFRNVLSPSGNLISSDVFPANDEIAEIKAVRTSDGGYLAFIQTGSFFSSTGIQMIKYNVLLNQEWLMPLSILNTLTGSTVSNLLDLDATASGVLFCLETATGVRLLHLSNDASTILWNKLVQTSSTLGVGVQPYPDGTIGFASYSAPFFYKKLSAAGLTLDSIASPSLPALSIDEPGFVFQADQGLYLFANRSYQNTSAYTIDRVTISGAITLAWSQTFGGAAPYEEETGTAIASSPDGGFVLAGAKQDSTGDNDVWVLRADALGAVLWEKTFVIANGFYHDARIGSVKLDATGNIIVLAASSGSSPAYHLLKLSPGGNLVFDKIIAMSDYDAEYYRAYPLPGGGFIACITLFDNDVTPILVRVNDSGAVLWTKQYNGNTVNDLVVLPDGSFICAGGKSGQPWIFKVSSNGNVIWEQLYPATTYSDLYSITSTSDGNLAAVGIAEDADETGIIAIALKAKTDDGALLWQKEFSKGDNSFWLASTALPTPAGGICFISLYLEPPADAELLTSIFRYRMGLSTLDANGSMIQDQSFGNDATHPFGQHADCTPDGKVIFCATTDFGLSTQDAWVVISEAKTVSTALKHPDEAGTLSIYPNPAKEQARFSLESSHTGQVQLQVFDPAGKEVASLQGEKNADNWQAELPLTAWTAGLYQIVVNMADGQTTQKMIVAH